MTVGALLFDLDDTLVADDASTQAAFLAACTLASRQYGVDPGALTRAVRRHARRLWRESPTIAYCRAIGISSSEGLRARFLGVDDPSLAALRDWAPTYRRLAWTVALGECGVADAQLALELAEAFATERRRRNEVFADVLPVLDSLQGAFKLGLVTNGSPDLQREKVAASGLERYFDVVIVSGEVGAGKPDARPFLLALEELGVSPAQAVMVGDSLERDVIGAQRVELRAVWLNRTGLTAANTRPDVEISELLQLPSVL